MANQRDRRKKLLEAGSRLFPPAEQAERFVQRLVGIVGGTGTLADDMDLGVVDSLLTPYVGLIVVMGAISLACGFWYSPVARSIHIALFVFAGIFGALSANRGNITSGFFVVFALVVLFEYRVDQRVAHAVGIVTLAAFVVALAIGYRDDVSRPVVSAIASMITLLTFVGLFVGITMRHRLLEIRHAQILERQIAERTAELKTALRERTVMLEEIHHRVKNNMQTVSTLLSMELDKLGDSVGRDALVASRNRIQAMSQVHDVLYGSGKLDRVELGAYTTDLVQALLQTSPHHVMLSLHVSEPVEVSISFASSYGLVVNELVTNAIRHAFSDGETSTLAVSMSKADATLDLRVADNGRGLPAGFDLKGEVGVGLTIVLSIVEHLNGTLDVYEDGGTEWRVRLPFKEQG